MNLGLKGNVVLITGGAKGIGAAIARACGREGGFPIIFDHDELAIHKIQSELHEEGIKADTVQVELTNSPDTSLAVENVGHKYGRIDGLVNNAGVNDGIGLENGSPERFASSLNCNLTHYFTIRVNAVVPAEVITPQYKNWVMKFDDPEEELRRIVARIPLGHRMTEPSEIAAMTVFLLSSKSAGITGQHLFVDGGYVHLDRRLT
jgi:L-fucose dehydrogenase